MRVMMIALFSWAAFTVPAWAQFNLNDALGGLGGALGGSQPAEQSKSKNKGAASDGTSSSGTLGLGLDDSQITSGIKQALSVATSRAVATVGQRDGYWRDEAIQIPLPGMLQRVEPLLRFAGQSGLVQDLHERMNRAAESAAPEAAAVFGDAIRQMSLSDARDILNGGDDSVTRYFEGAMSDPLKDRMRPIVDAEMAEVGVLQAANALAAQAGSVPGLNLGQINMSDYVLDGALSGLFHHLAQEEKAIRQNPVSRTTDLLKSVFGG